MIRIIQNLLLLGLIPALCACGTYGETTYKIRSAWADKNDIYILYEKHHYQGLYTVLNPHGSTHYVDKTNYFYQKLDKSKLKNGDEVDLRQGTSADDLIYLDSNFLVEKEFSSKLAEQSDLKATITTRGIKSTVLCKHGKIGKGAPTPIGFEDKLMYCGYVTPVGGSAVAARPEIFEHGLDPGAFKDRDIYFYTLATKRGDEIEKEPIVLTKINMDSYKVTGTVALPFLRERFRKFPESGYFKHGFIIVDANVSRGHIVYACKPEKCRRFDLNISYNLMSSAMFVEDSGDALMVFTNTSDMDSKSVFMVSIINADPDTVDSEGTSNEPWRDMGTKSN